MEEQRVAQESEKPVIATIALKGGGFIEPIKRRDDIKVFEITYGNRDFISGEILDYAKVWKSRD